MRIYQAGFQEGVKATPLDQNPAIVYLIALRPKGRYSQRRVLNLVARLLGETETRDKSGKEITFLTCPWSALRCQHMEAIRSKLEGSYSPSTVNKALAAVRGVLRPAWQLGQITEEDYRQTQAVKGLITTKQPASRMLTTREIAALVAACKSDPTPAGARDAAIIDVAYTSGLLRAELSELDLADYDADTGKLTVCGDGSNERSFYLIGGVRRAMSAWLALRGNQPGAFFRPVSKGGQILTRRLTSQAIYNLLEKRGKEGGVKGFTANDLRRTFINDLLNDGVDLSTVAQMAGHASATTTGRYVWKPEDDRRKVP